MMSKFLRTASHRSGMRLGQRLRARRFNSRFKEFMATGEPKQDDHALLLSAFLESSGRSLTRAAQQLRSKRPQEDFTWAPDTLRLSDHGVSPETVVSQLDESGYAILPVLVPNDLLSAAMADLRSAQCRVSSDDPEHNGKLLSVGEGKAAIAEKYAVLTREVANCPQIASLFLDQGLLRIAQDYIGGPPVIDIATAWFSFPSEKPSSEAAQQFHFDLDRIKWLKAFFYLNDVTRMNGAHTFVPGSHKDGVIPREILDRGYARLDDDEVARFFPEDSWLHAEGQQGTILLEDTRGLHKGSRLQEGYRLIAQVQYSLSLFGGPSKVASTNLDGTALWKMIPESNRQAILGSPTAVYG